MVLALRMRCASRASLRQSRSYLSVSIGISNISYLFQLITILFDPMLSYIDRGTGEGGTVNKVHCGLSENGE